MSLERWRQVEEIYHSALQRTPEQRRTFVVRACRGDAELLREVESLLAHNGSHEAAPSRSLEETGADPAGRAAISPVIPGEHFGRYRIVSKIGEGGMGVVYSAHDERLNRSVALKTLRQSTLDRVSERRLWREARIAASLNHPSICQLYDVGEERGLIYLVMELLEGESLAHRISRGPLDLPAAIQTMLAMLAALDVLHGKKLTHRDLKPSNIFITPHGVKLLDFGLARKMPQFSGNSTEPTETAITQAGTIVGTPHYLAPEQLLGREPDERADLFAAGAILFELLTGRRAFNGPSTVAILHAVLYEQPPALSGSPAICAADLVVRRALAKKPEERYQTAQAMADELRALALRDDTAAPAQARAMTRLIVLPFRMLRPDPEFDFLTFSLPDAITNSLSGLASLVVRSSMSASRYAGQSPDLKEIAAEAEVDAVLTGTLLRGGDQLRVTTQLAEAPGGAVLWSHISQLGLQDIFQLQDELVRRVVESLALPLTGPENQLLKHDVPASPMAYEYYLRANQLDVDVQQARIARDLYLKCIDLDPRYAPAWARLGRCYRVIAKYEGDGQDFQRAESALQRAFDLNPELNLAHGYYAQLEADMGRAPQAMVRLLERARTHPNDPNLFAGLVQVCRFCGLLPASIAAHQHARRLDPLIPTSVAHAYLMAGEYQKALENNPEGNGPFDVFSLTLLGRDEEALELIRNCQDQPLHRLVRGLLVPLCALLEGKHEEGRAALERWSMLQENRPRGEELYYIGRLFARLEDSDLAIAKLQGAVEQGFACYPFMARDPWLDPLRTDARLTAVLGQAEARHERARDLFIQAGGVRILGDV